MDTIKFIKQNAKCCISGKPLTDSKHINAVQLMLKASWKYPMWGNLISAITDMAVAYIHDDCIVDGKMVGEIKFAIEIDKERIIYHPVAELKKP